MQRYATEEGEKALLLAVQHGNKEALAFLIESRHGTRMLEQVVYHENCKESWGVFLEAVKSNDIDIPMMLFNVYPYSYETALIDIQKLVSKQQV